MTMSNYSKESSLKAYNIIWSEVIEKLIEKHKSKHIDLIVDDDAKEKIWNNYTLFKCKCRQNYMDNQHGLLDRHKVSACMIYGIIKSSVIYEDIPKSASKRSYSIINEDLALTVGLSILRAFIELEIRKCGMPDAQKRETLVKFQNGLKFPTPFHGNYRDNFLAELHFTKQEGCYNILSLSHSLYLLEVYTRYC